MITWRFRFGRDFTFDFLPPIRIRRGRSRGRRGRPPNRPPPDDPPENDPPTTDECPPGGCFIGHIVPVTPLPDPPPTQPRTSYPSTFPRGPAANDPVFGRPDVRFGNLRTVLAYLAAILLEAQRRAARRAEAEKMRRGEEADKRQREADEQIREVEFPAEEIPQNDDFGMPPRPEFEPFPHLPRSPFPARNPEIETMPSTFPDQTPSIPDLFPTFPLGLPRRAPGPVRQPSGPQSNPVAPINPNVNPWSPFAPRPEISPRPGTSPSPGNRPAFDPVVPGASDIVPLTPIRPGGVVSPILNLNPAPGLNLNPQRCPQRQKRCKEDNKRRTECFKKLVVERAFPKWDKETKWTEIDCTTGREL